MEMELPPAFRGYGRKDSLIENPLSAQREAEIEEIKKTLDTVDRFTVQEALLEYELPGNLKHKNERVGVGYA
jgi:fumarate reductase flavoprotein subunit